jgi:hypothetical protein
MILSIDICGIRTFGFQNEKRLPAVNYIRVCLKNPQRAENASFRTWSASFFRAIGLAIPLKNEIAQNLKSAVFFSVRIFQTHPSSAGTAPPF